MRKNTTASTPTSSRNETGIVEVRPDSGLVAMNSAPVPNSFIAVGMFGICTELSAPCMMPENTLAVPNVMISAGIAIREVSSPLKAPRIPPSRIASRKGSHSAPS